MVYDVACLSVLVGKESGSDEGPVYILFVCLHNKLCKGDISCSG